MSLDEMLTIAQNAARIAGDHAREHINCAQTSLKPTQESKTPDQGEIVTQVDLECQKIIIEQIQRRFPEHGIIAEEGQMGRLYKKPPSDPQGTWWVIDPIDGTRNYAHGAPNFVVSIAAMQGGFPVIGAIYDPSTSMLFSAQSDKPAQCNGKVIRCRDEILNANSQLAISSNFFKNLPHCAMEIAEKYVYMNLGSAALHYCYVAMGAFSAAVSWQVKLWDIAAGALIAQRAGAVVNNIEFNKRFPVDCNSYQGESLPIIVGHDSIQRQLEKIIRK